MNKRKKKNKYIPLIVLLAFIVVMAAAYTMLSSANDKKEAEQAAEAAAANAVEMIAEYDYTTTVGLTYQRAGSDPVKLQVVNGQWKLTDDENFPVNQTTVAAMANAIASIGIRNHVTEGDPADYGLAEPAYTIEVTYDGGVSHQYRIGDYNSFGGGAYYFMMDGAMYTIPTGLTSYFDYELADLLQLDTMPTDIEQDYINSITVTADGAEKVIDDANGIASLFDIFNDITLTECADYYTDETERTETYGLDGSDKITISYKRAVTSTDAEGNQTTNRLDTSYTFLFGKEHDGAYYVSPEKSTIAYLVSAETVEKIAAYMDYEPAPAEDAVP
ncbi:MAG: DUF4340 domain-containing protein [Clostridia bacterium]|nr:DUF4340 domain-containing protein [Clostridia bacterium]